MPRPAPTTGRIAGALVALLAVCVCTAHLRAEPMQAPRVPTASGGVVQGAVTTQQGTIPLGGVLVSLSSDLTAEVTTVLTEGDGTFRFEGLPPGRYRVEAGLEGFEALSVAVTVVWNEIARVPLDLPLSLSQRVEVTAPAAVVPEAGTLSAGEAVSSEELEELGSGGGLQSALRLLASVIEVPGGVAIKGGRPSQATVQLERGMFVDPATGLSQARLPDDAIDTVTVLPNPYAVEYGRFSSGLVLIQTRRAADQWKTRVNRLDPTFRTRRGAPLDVEGIATFNPRIEVGGPLYKDRVFLQEAAQYRYRASEVASRPQTDLKRSHGFSSFTRLDANLSPRHALIVAGGLFPNTSRFATLGTFTPPEASVDLDADVRTVSATERAVWSDGLFTETTAEMNRYDTEVRPQRRAPMELLPETTLGPFYNRQRRMTSTYQFIETLSGSRQGGTGLHLYKIGVDVLHSRFEGSSTSTPVLVRRSNGTLARRLDFGPPTRHTINSTDFALFAQDRFQPTSRWYVEFGVRLDRDGVIDRLNLTPRVGSAVLLNESGTSVLRGGFGVFYERTPSAAGIFDRYENVTETRFAPDGVTPLGPPSVFEHVTAPDLDTSRSLTWDLVYDHRFTDQWALRLGVIDRRGTNELMVDPVTTGPDPRLLLHSDGRSSYREAEVGLHFTDGPRLDFNVSYVRARARADLNAFTVFFDSVRWPVFGENQYAPARTDTPHRLLARGRAMPTPSWLLIGVVDWRTGLPYSVVDDARDFVGRRNTRRFPAHLRLELGIEHRFRIFRFRPWIGVRADNALNAFLPLDVQNNIGSPAFGSFYNSEFRQFRIQVRFQR
jgi:hypothetical protein